MRLLSILLLAELLSGCATIPTYAIRPTPVPNDRPDIVNLERMLSETQAQQLESQAALYDVSVARDKGFDVEGIVQKLGRVSERPNLYYRVHVLGSSTPNAVALADGRVYVTLGMLDYLKNRGSHEDELAFILGHEIGHICAQHLVQSVQQIQGQQALGILAILTGAMIGAASSNPYSPYYNSSVNAGAQLGQVVAQAINNAQTQGFSQEQELAADQLGLRYVIKAGYHPEAAIALLEDFNRFEFYGPFIQTHPPSPRRAEDLRRFLVDMQVPTAPQSGERASRGATIVSLDAQQSEAGKELSNEVQSLSETAQALNRALPTNTLGSVPSGVPTSATEWRWVNFVSRPPGAKIYIENKFICTTPCTGSLWYRQGSMGGWADVVIEARWESWIARGISKSRTVHLPPIPDYIEFVR